MCTRKQTQKFTTVDFPGQTQLIEYRVIKNPYLTGTVKEQHFRLRTDGIKVVHCWLSSHFHDFYYGGEFNTTSTGRHQMPKLLFNFIFFFYNATKQESAKIISIHLPGLNLVILYRILFRLVSIFSWKNMVLKQLNNQHTQIHQNRCSLCGIPTHYYFV